MRFDNNQWQSALWMLPAIIGLLFYAQRRGIRQLRQLLHAPLWQSVLPGFSPSRRLLQLALYSGALCFIFIALLRPQWGYRWEMRPDRGTDLFVVVDVSDSMRATDLQPNRLERARRKLRDLLPMLRGERLGLVAFAGDAFLLCPLTLDYEAFALFLDYLDTDLIPVQGTNIAAAIEAATRGFEEQSPRQREILLITDGEDHESGMQSALDTAKKHKTRLSVIGIGSPDGAPIPATGGGFRKDQSGNVILSRLNETALETLAVQSGGRYARSVAGDIDLQHLVRDGMSANGGKDGATQSRRQVFEERYQWFLLPGLLFWLAALLLPQRRDVPLLCGWLIAGWLVFGAPSELHAGELGRGIKAYERQDYETALRHFAEGQVERQQDPSLHYNLGNTHYRLQRYAEAQRAYEQALAPQNLENAGLDAAARQQLEHDALYNLGNALFQQQDYAAAIPRYEQALKLQPQDADAQHNLELAKKMLQQQEQEQQQQEQEQKQDQERQPQEQQPQQEDSQEPSSPPQETNPQQQKAVSPEEAKAWLSGIEEDGKKALKESLKMKMMQRRTPQADW